MKSVEYLKWKCRTSMTEYFKVARGFLCSKWVALQLTKEVTCMWWDFCVGAEVFYPHFINRFAYHTNDHIDAVIVIIAIISLSYLLPKFKKATWRPELTYQYFRLTMSCGWCERDIWFLYKPCQARDYKTTNWPEPFAVWTNCKARLLLLRIRELVRRVRLLLEQVNQMRQW